MTRSCHRCLVSGLFAAGLLFFLEPLGAQSQYYGGGPQITGSGFGKNKIQYREFEWTVYHSPHFNVHYYTQEEPALQKVVSFAESAYDQLAREFNFQIKDPVPLIYYSTHSAFEQNNIILNFIPEGVGAFASPARFRMVLPIDMADPELMQLILHELTHIFQYHMLFQGSLAKAVTTAPPTWFMEGMASYMAKDETQRDKMYLRDSVVNDRIPSVTRSDFGGFFAYRFGHAVFDFIEERWGKDGFLDFLFEVRNTIGSRVDRAVRRAFKMEPEDFDIEFRRWLRRKYLPQLVETGEPSDFGRIFRIEDFGSSEVTSPAASPSGELVAALSGYKGDVDLVLFDAKNRRMLRNLTSGFTNEYQYLVAQELSLGRRLGRDIGFSPDGNTIAVFAKRERGRSLLLIDLLGGGLRSIIDMDDLEQQSSPAWSPDGRTIAFSAWHQGKFDIFALDVEARTITNITDDDLFDGAPVFSPDGRSVVMVSAIGTGYNKIFRVDLDKPGSRFALTTGESNENDPVFTPDGKRIYFTSDRNGPENIFGLDLTTSQLRQHTDVVTGAFMPTVLRQVDEPERLVFTGFWKQSFDLYVTETGEPVADPQTVQIPAEPGAADSSPFKVDIEVSLDDANKEPYNGRRFFLADAQTVVGVNSDQSYLGQILLTFSDYLGDRRIFTTISTVDSFSNFHLVYADFSDRLQWQVHLFDDRTYYLFGDPVTGRIEEQRTAFQITGAIGSLIYPLTFYTRAELGLGYLYRKDVTPFEDFLTGEVFFVSFSEDFPMLQASLVGDSTVFANFGAIDGRRWRLNVSYAPDLEASGTLFQSANLEVRQYLQVTDRSNIAMRAFGGYSNGNRPWPYYFGGLDTLRGFPFRSVVGDRAFFANLEYRFPLIDLVATPVFAFQGIRGVIFVDLGGAWYNDFEDFDFYDEDTKRLEDGVASYGFGLTTRFLGMELNWDFSRRWDFKDASDFETEFWVGYRF